VPAAPLMAVMMVIAMNPSIMGRLTLPRPMLVVGWLARSVMALATVESFSIWTVRQQTGMGYENKPSSRCHPENNPRQK
jgi:hypothetical protein